jgi:hypothetical protein
MSKIKSQITIFEDKTCVDDRKMNTTALENKENESADRPDIFMVLIKNNID